MVNSMDARAVASVECSCRIQDGGPRQIRPIIAEAVYAFRNTLMYRFMPGRTSSQIRINLMDLDGSVVRAITDSTYDSTPTELKSIVSHLDKGIYFLRINMNGKQSQQRIIE